jgi:hypothetical protein
MADKVEVEVGGASKYEIAHLMALNILTVIEKKKLADVPRADYLKAVSLSVQALQGHL